jgi:hypothetical protein
MKNNFDDGKGFDVNTYKDEYRLNNLDALPN